MKYFVSVNGESQKVVVDERAVHAEGGAATAHVTAVPGTPLYAVTIGDTVHRVIVKRGSTRGQYTLSLGGYRFEVEALNERAHTIRQLAGATAAPAGPAPLRAPMPGLIVRVNVQVGDEVQAGQGLVVMEAMKMENELRASAPGRVKAIVVAPGTAVEKGALLLEME